MTHSLLPPNASRLERAIEVAMLRRLGAIPTPIRTLWNPDTCPADLLSWLAWSHSVDVWDNDWSEAAKRQVIRSAFMVHRHKGTIGSVRRALAALNIALEIREWFETGDAPGTFRIDAFADYIFAAGFGINSALLALISAQIDTIKPARAHYTLRVGERFTAQQYVRAGMRAKAVDINAHDPQPRTYEYASTAATRTGSRIRIVHRHTHDVLIRSAA